MPTWCPKIIIITILIIEKNIYIYETQLPPTHANLVTTRATVAPVAHLATRVQATRQRLPTHLPAGGGGARR